jgi:TonB family protein
LRWILAAFLAFPALAWAQSPAGVLGGLGSGRIVQRAPLAPVPSDPLELVPSGAHLVQTADERGAVIALLNRARELSNVRAQPYDLKTTFNVFLSGAANGAWHLEDTSPVRDSYRWTAQGSAYSAVYLYKNDILHSDQRGGAIPLRLIQVREAIFFTYPIVTKETQLRAANGYLNGVELKCVLVQQRPQPPGQIAESGRGWDEFEYCVDPKSGQLITYSRAPGLYVHYDYANALHFHKQILPGAFTISVARQSVIEARTAGVSDPASPNGTQFEPGNLPQLGVGSVMTAPVGAFMGLSVPAGGASNSQTVRDEVTVDGELWPDGHVSDPEILASTNDALNQSALNRASQWRQPGFPQNQPGTTPQTRQIIFRFTATPPQPMRPSPPPSALITNGANPPVSLPPSFPVRPVPNGNGVAPCDSCPSSQPLPAPLRVKVGEDVQAGRLIARLLPEYPPLAQQARIQGNVVLHAIIGIAGNVQELQVISGHPLLVKAALDAVERWRYEPAQLNGQPVQVDTTITVPFVLGQ